MIRFVAALLLSLSVVNISSCQPQLHSPRGVVNKAGPAFRWLQRLDQAELVAVDEKCQQGATLSRSGSVPAANNSSIPPLDRIIGAQLALAGQFPYAAALGNSHTYTSLCGATLISPRHLLTAAHCVLSNMSVEPQARINQTVWLGGVCYYASAEDGCPAPDMFEAEMELAVQVYYSYSARDSREWNTKIRREPADLALIQLRAPVDRRLFESGRVDYACLPPPLPTPLPASLHNIGWGDHSDAEGDYDSAHLRFVRLITQPRKEWSPEMQNLRTCHRTSQRFCQYPPGRDQAASYLGDSGSGALARRGAEGASANADVLYAVQSSFFRASYSVNASDPREPYVQRILGDDVSLQHHLDELCYYLQLGCGVKGITGVGTTLRLSSFYLKRKRSEMPSIAPFTLLSDDGPIAGHAAPEKAVAALVVAGNGGGKEQVICVAVAISPRHLVTTRACIIMDKYLRDWRGQTTGGGIIAVTSCDTNPPSQQCANRVEFIAWQRAVTTQAYGQQAVAGSELAIVQLTTTDNPL